MISKPESFVARYQGIGDAELHGRFLQRTTFLASGHDENLVMLLHVNEQGAPRGTCLEIEHADGDGRVCFRRRDFVGCVLS
jgi:hypothetical protein